MSAGSGGGDVAGAAPAPGDEIAVECTIAAPAALVWRALADPRLRSKWWPGLELEAVPGGALRERWIEDGAEQVAEGTVREVVSGERLRFSWSEPSWEAPTTVAIGLVGSEGVTLVRVVESGLARLSSGREIARAHEAGWTWHLGRLRELAEST